MRTIIVPTDFSPAATNALHYGIEMTRAIQGELLLFHTYQVPVSYSDVPILLVSVEDLARSAEEKMAVLKTEVEHITSGAMPIRTEAVMGNLADELEKLSEQINPFAVVMGSQGSSGMERTLFGSSTLSVVKQITSPVICIPPGKNYGPGIKKIGFACDLQHIAESTPVDAIKSLVKEFNAELHVLNVDHDNKHFTATTPGQSTILHELFKELNPVYHYIENDDAEDGINDFAELNNLDLIIIIPKKHTVLDRIFNQGSTRQLVLHAHVPVMCVHE